MSLWGGLNADNVYRLCQCTLTADRVKLRANRLDCASRVCPALGEHVRPRGKTLAPVVDRRWAAGYHQMRVSGDPMSA